jgi:hypothetical protein
VFAPQLGMFCAMGPPRDHGSYGSHPASVTADIRIDLAFVLASQCRAIGTEVTVALWQKRIKRLGRPRKRWAGVSAPCLGRAHFSCLGRLAREFTITGATS